MRSQTPLFALHCRARWDPGIVLFWRARFLRRPRVTTTILGPYR